ncbi:hypothetical protein G6Z94_09250 [Vibrio aestuarianus]|uniref:DUF4875 domain-containing protein n=1 Tax=Vibrio aestuarianus TaxID=28171 RepID=UPI001593EE4A|nr:hypothetical protein [Vibrio aestuarianus]NGZ17529.1 hypothetical protein [Vibrio aestuarianus]
MFKKFLFIAIGSLFLYGCGDEIVVPEQYTDSAEFFNVIIEESTKNGIKVVRANADINPDEMSQKQRASTAIELARSVQAKTDARVVYASLWDPTLKKASYVSRAQLFVAKCDFNEENCNDVQWVLETASNTPTTKERKIARFWWSNKDAFQTASGTTDEPALKEYISEQLNLELSEVSLFFYENWTNVDKI